MARFIGIRWFVTTSLAVILAAFFAACTTTETIEVKGEPVIVEKEVVKEVIVQGETTVVEKVVTETIEVKGETVVKEVVKEVAIPGAPVIKEVEKVVEVVKEVRVQVPVLVEKEIVKIVKVPGKEYVTDPTNGMVYTAPQYGGQLNAALDRVPPNADQSVGGLGAGYAISGVVEKLGVANWGIDRNINPLSNEFLAESDFQGNLAESWEIPDPLTYIFKIREGVHWHDKAPMNGRALTAEDVVFNYHRLTGTGSGFTEPSSAQSQLPQLKYESITAGDGNTVVFKLTEPRFDALTVFIDDHTGYINAPEVIKEYGNVVDWKTLVGTGPFELVEWVEGDSLTFEKNPNYWKNDEKYPDNQLPYIDTLKHLLIMEAATYTAALRAGKVDYMAHNVSTQLKSVDQALSLARSNPEINNFGYSFRANNCYAFNTTEAPFDELKVRKAMQMALDLDTINKTYWSGYADTTPQTIIGSVQKGYGVLFKDWPAEVQAGYTYNPEGAEALLDEAGYPRDGDGGTRFKTAVELNAKDADGLEYAEIAVAYWAEIGVHVEIKMFDGSVAGARAKSQEYEGMTPFIGATPYNPLVSLAWQYSTDVNNRGGWNDAAYDALVDEARKATSVAQLAAASTQAAMHVTENHWYISSPLSPWYNFSQPWVQGFNGDWYSGMWQKNNVFARLWIDQDLKARMGH